MERLKVAISKLQSEEGEEDSEEKVKLHICVLLLMVVSSII